MHSKSTRKNWNTKTQTLSRVGIAPLGDEECTHVILLAELEDNTMCERGWESVHRTHFSQEHKCVYIITFALKK